VDIALITLPPIRHLRIFYRTTSALIHNINKSFGGLRACYDFFI